jgi:microcompartment protein CcmK/EutM
MKIFKVIGSVTLCRSHPTYQGARLLATEPLDASIYGGPPPVDPDLVVVWDDLGAGLDSNIAVSDGGEAANPFKPALKPVDAYCSAMLDTIHIEPEAIQQLNLN